MPTQGRSMTIPHELSEQLDTDYTGTQIIYQQRTAEGVWLDIPKTEYLNIENENRRIVYSSVIYKGPIWSSGTVPDEYTGVWLLADTKKNGRRIVQLLPPAHRYAYMDADGIYYNPNNIIRWMPFPDTQIPFPKGRTIKDDDVIILELLNTEIEKQADSLDDKLISDISERLYQASRTLSLLLSRIPEATP